MSALAVPHRTAAENGYRELAEQNVSPIVVAVDGSAASRAAIGEAIRLAGELDAPIVFVYVRRGPARFLGTPVYQRRLTKEMARARRALDRALAVADSAGVFAQGEILEGSPRRRIPEFARDRDARLVVGSRQPRASGSSDGASQAASSARREDRLSSPRVFSDWRCPGRRPGRGRRTDALDARWSGGAAGGWRPGRAAG